MRKTIKLCAVIGAMAMLMTACGNQTEEIVPVDTELPVNVSKGDVNYTAYTEAENIEIENMPASDSLDAEEENEKPFTETFKAEEPIETTAEENEKEVPPETSENRSDSAGTGGDTSNTANREYTEEEKLKADKIYPLQAVRVSDDFDFASVSIDDKTFDLREVTVGSFRNLAEARYIRDRKGYYEDDNFYFFGRQLNGNYMPDMFFECLDGNEIPIRDWNTSETEDGYVYDEYKIKAMFSLKKDSKNESSVVFAGQFCAGMKKEEIEGILGSGYELKFGDDNEYTTVYYENSTAAMVVSYEYISYKKKGDVAQQIIVVVK